MPQHQQSNPTPLVILTGFLGSGKTTLLNRLLCDPLLGDTAVVVNEFGQIGIDHLLILPVADDVVLLESGCVCCSAGEDLGVALLSLLARRKRGELPPFRRIVLETTGIADPAALLQRILSDSAIAPDLRIHSVLTVVDAAFGGTTLDRHPECTLQIAVANRLILSKLDLVESTAVDALVARLQSINPSAPIIASGFQDLDSATLLADTTDAGLTFGAIAPAVRVPPAVPDARAPLASGPAGTARARHSDRYETFCLCWDDPLAWNDVEAWLEALLIARGESILRMKGLLRVAGREHPLVVQSVQHALYPPTELREWPRGAPRSEFIFVTRDFSSRATLRSLQQCFPQVATFSASTA